MIQLSFRQARLCLLICMSLSFHSARGQFQHTTSYEFPDNLKGYSVAMVSDKTAGTTGEAVMAGTIYNYNGTGRNAVHFIYKGDNGGINASKYFDDAAQADFRAVGIVSNGATTNAVYSILCQVRPFGGNDHAMLIDVDKWGNLIGAMRVVPNLASNGLYPLHIIHHSNGSNYICGYETDNNTAYPAEPNYSGYGHKRAFISRILSPNNTNFISTNYVSPLGVPKDDYDIAMRMVEVNGGNIFVTGSVNNCKLDTYTGDEVFFSGTMNLLVDPTGFLAPINADHFGVMWNGENPFVNPVHEHGIGLVQDLVTGDNYVIGNVFIRYASSPGTIFDPVPIYAWAARVDANFYRTPTTNLSRVRFQYFDNAWALGTLPSASTPNPGNVQFLLAGLQDRNGCNTAIDWKDSIAPFLYDVGLRYNGTIVADLKKWVAYKTQTGTRLNTAPNSYWNLGSGLSNVLWNPVFAARNSLADDIVMSAPRVSPAGGGRPPRLNLKSIRVNNALVDPDCLPGSLDHTCALVVPRFEAVDGLGWPGHPVTNRYYGGFPALIHYATVNNLATGDYNSLSQKFCPEDGIVFREELTNVNDINTREAVTKIYPNPAKDQVKVSLSSHIANNARVSVVLLNIYGQVVGNLYNGSANDLNTFLQLPNTVPGIYIVKVLVDDKSVHQERLSIE